MDLITKENLSLMGIKSDSLLKITERLPEINRARQTGGRSNTATTNQLMTLNMSGDDPYRHLRQILAQIENKMTALEDSHFRLKKDLYTLKTLDSSSDELSKIEADEIRTKIRRARIYIEGAVKEIGIFQDAYDDIRKSHKIPENWDEADSEKAEIRNHIKVAFRNAFQEMMSTGMIGRGSAEYLEQFGVHAQSARKHLHDYIVRNEKSLEKGKFLSIKSFHDFLDKMADIFEDEHKICMHRIGLKQLIRDNFLYSETA